MINFSILNACMIGLTVQNLQSLTFSKKIIYVDYGELVVNKGRGKMWSCEYIISLCSLLYMMLIGSILWANKGHLWMNGGSIKV